MTDLDVPAVLSVKDLCRQVQRHHLFRNVSFELRMNKVLAVVGPSGSGKSSLLRCLAGVDRPTHGSITLSEKAGPVILVWQDLALFDHLSVRANVEFGPRASGWPRKKVSDAADRELENFHLKDYANRAAGTLSGGERQRLALARALAIRPSVLLLDEPFSSLDVVMRDEFRSLVKKRVDQTAMVVVTHDREDVFALADQVAVMDHFAAMTVTSVDMFASTPPTEFAARFSGCHLVFNPCINECPPLVVVPYTYLNINPYLPSPSHFSVKVMRLGNSQQKVSHCPISLRLVLPENGDTIVLPSSVAGDLDFSSALLCWPRSSTLVIDATSKRLKPFRPSSPQPGE